MWACVRGWAALKVLLPKCWLCLTKWLASVARFNFFPPILHNKKTDIYCSYLSSQTESPSPSLLWNFHSTSLLSGVVAESASHLSLGLREKVSRGKPWLLSFLPAAFSCLPAQLVSKINKGWGMALIQSRALLLANAGNRYFKSASLLFRSCTVWPAVHEAVIF